MSFESQLRRLARKTKSMGGTKPKMSHINDLKKAIKAFDNNAAPKDLEAIKRNMIANANALIELSKEETNDIAAEYMSVMLQLSEQLLVAMNGYMSVVE